MARYLDSHPANPKRRAIVQIAEIVRAGGVIAFPTDSCYPPGCQLGNRDGITRIKSIRDLGDPGSYTFILPATKEVPRILQHPRKKTVGVRIPRRLVTQALLAELGEALAAYPTWAARPAQ